MGEERASLGETGRPASRIMVGGMMVVWGKGTLRCEPSMTSEHTGSEDYSDVDVAHPVQHECTESPIPRRTSML